MRLPTRVAGIIINEDKILLMHRKKSGEEYWVFPGGGLEDTDSSPEKGLKREVLEETSIKVTVDKLIYRHDYTTNDGLYYLCSYLSGKPVLGDSIEKQRMQQGNSDLYEPLWFELIGLPGLLLYPLEIRDWLVEDYKNGFVNTPREQKIDSKSLRKV